jgi:ankyrin repeat protein
MTWLMRLMIAAWLGALAAAAPAQIGGHDGEKFVELVRQGDNAEALALLQRKPIIIDAVDTRGDTALLAAIRNRDHGWTAHLLHARANPNLAPRGGDTPLIAATRAGFTEAARWLLGVGAKVDANNRRGETALIVAVQERDQALVELLLSAGADPDRADSAAGYSARDYAKRETRFPALLGAIEARKSGQAPKAASEDLNGFKLN